LTTAAAAGYAVRRSAAGSSRVGLRGRDCDEGFGQQCAEVLFSGQDLGKSLAQVASRVDAELLAGGDQGERVGGASSADVVSDEHPCFAIEDPASQVALDLIIRELHERVAQKRGEPWPLPVQVAEGLAEQAFWLDIGSAQIDPGAQLSDERCAELLASCEALCEALDEALRFGIHVEDRRVEAQPFYGSRVACAKRLDQLAAAVRVAPSTASAGALDAVVGGRTVAHHAAEASAIEQFLEVVVVAAGGVEEAGVAMSPFDEPERAAADAEGVRGVEHGNACGIERRERGRKAGFPDMADDRVEQVDDTANAQRGAPLKSCAIEFWDSTA
jgi:hypothetical protein